MAKRVDPQIETFARIKVVGVGGAGGAAVNRMIEAGVADVEFVAVNTDAQALHHNQAPVKLNIGPQTTRGLGAGGDPKIGQDAAQESIDEIKRVIADTDILFLTLGAGGGTGSGAAHVIAQASRELGILTVAFVTKPFGFEIDRRSRNAEFAISNLEKHVDTLVLIPNDNLLNIIDSETPVQEAFKIADDVLRQGVQGIADLITVSGLINLDFADVKAIMQNAGQALMGIGRAGGENRAEVAAQQAINSPLLEVSIDGAKGILLNVIGGENMTMHEINTAASVITEAADQDANVIFGATINANLEDEIIVTVVATGFNSGHVKAVRSDNFYDADPLAALPESKALKTPPAEKISSPDDLPSLPPRGGDKPKKDKEKPKDKPAEPESPPAPEPDIEDIVKDIDTTLEDDATGDQEQVTPLMDDDDSDTARIWDDVEIDDDKTVDLNKPAFLRKLAAKRRERKEKKNQNHDEELSADDE